MSKCNIKYANEQNQISDELKFKLEEKTIEAKHLYEKVEDLLTNKDMKDTKENHDLKVKLSSTEKECQKARANLIEHKKENEKNKK